MKAFARHRSAKAKQNESEALISGQFDGGQPDPALGDDFIERLGNLDQFIGAATVAPGEMGPAQSAGIPTNVRMPAAPGAPRDPSGRRLFEATDDGSNRAAAAPDQSHEDEAEEFLERLGDLDRFIGGPGSTESIAPMATSPGPMGTPAPNPTGAVAPNPDVSSAATPAQSQEDEAEEFLERLGDLDRFIGGPTSPRSSGI